MSDAAPAVPAVAPAGGNNKMMFIAMGVMFVVLMGGMAGMFFMMKSGNKTSGDAAAGKAEEAKAKAAAIYVGFEPPFVVNFPADSQVKFMQISVQIMTREANVEHEIKSNDPAIRDALLILFGEQTADKMATAQGKEQLRKDALEAVRNVIKHEGGEADKVEAIYFTSFVMQ